jgi:hypothetical protein
MVHGFWPHIRTKIVFTISLTQKPYSVKVYYLVQIYDNNPMLSKVVVFVVASFLLVTLICSLVSLPIVFALKAIGPQSCTSHPNQLGPSGTIGVNLTLCCQSFTDSEGIEVTYCTACDDTNPPSHCTKPFILRTGGLTNGQTGLPGRLPTLGYTGTRGLTGNPPSTGTAPATPSNNTVKQFPGSILPNKTGNVIPPKFPIPPVTVHSLGNNSGTRPSGNNTNPPTLTITKEHNPASPNVLSLAGNVTNPGNSTGPVKLSPLTTTTSGGHHHHKGSTSTSSTGSNSTGH